jgi:hypothetical protein
MLWLYSENDRYWGKLLPKKCFDGFVSAGGQATLVELPRYKDDGLQALRAIASPGALHSKSF